jgi:hypothetical protein
VGALAVLGAGCGSATSRAPAPPTKSAFIAQALQICNATIAQADQARERPAIVELSDRLLQASRKLSEGLRRLRALDFPQEDRGLLADYLDATQVVLHSSIKLSKVAKKVVKTEKQGDLDELNMGVKLVRASTSRQTASAERYGIGGCAAQIVWPG